MSTDNLRLPFKSVGGALLFTVLLGPLGLLYASQRGALLMLFLLLVAMSGQFKFLILLVWVGSCVWSVSAVERFNRKNIKS